MTSASSNAFYRSIVGQQRRHAVAFHFCPLRATSVSNANRLLDGSNPFGFHYNCYPISRVNVCSVCRAHRRRIVFLADQRRDRTNSIKPRTEPSAVSTCAPRRCVRDLDVHEAISTQRSSSSSSAHGAGEREMCQRESIAPVALVKSEVRRTTRHSLTLQRLRMNRLHSRHVFVCEARLISFNAARSDSSTAVFGRDTRSASLVITVTS